MIRVDFVMHFRFKSIGNFLVNQSFVLKTSTTISIMLTLDRLMHFGTTQPNLLHQLLQFSLKSFFLRRFGAASTERHALGDGQAGDV